MYVYIYIYRDMLKCTLYIYIHVCVIIFNPYLDGVQMPKFSPPDPKILPVSWARFGPAAQQVSLLERLVSQGISSIFRGKYVDVRDFMWFYGGVLWWSCVIMLRGFTRNCCVNKKRTKERSYSS